MYALAAELNVPIRIHFQEVSHTPTEGVFATGFRNFEAMLKAYPKTKFIGHADAFWANISADYANEAAYPAGKIKRGGVTDRLLGDYPNLYGDLSANSGNNALSRDPEFTPGFLERHQDKLIFGSDCACSDGKGGGVSQGKNPPAARMAGGVRVRDGVPAQTDRLTGRVSKARLGQRAQDVCLEGLKDCPLTRGRGLLGEMMAKSLCSWSIQSRCQSGFRGSGARCSELEHPSCSSPSTVHSVAHGTTPAGPGTLHRAFARWPGQSFTLKCNSTARR
jgi:hypothetical protein